MFSQRSECSGAVGTKSASKPTTPAKVPTTTPRVAAVQPSTNDDDGLEDCDESDETTASPDTSADDSGEDECEEEEAPSADEPEEEECDEEEGCGAYPQTPGAIFIRGRPQSASETASPGGDRNERGGAGRVGMHYMSPSNRGGPIIGIIISINGGNTRTV